MRKTLLIIITLLYCSQHACQADAYSSRLGLPSVAFWIWTPKNKTLVNPKYAAKDTPEEQFKWAMQFYEDKNYKRAAEEFNILVTHFKESKLAPEAQYYAGRSYEEAKRYYPAFTAYQKAIDMYPYIKRIDEIIEREYNLGMELYSKHSGRLMGKEIMTDLERAVEVFQKVRENAPFGEYADKAQFMVGECYKKGEQYNEAIGAYQKLVDEYPHSELADKAMYEIAQSTYLASLKADYDQELTDEAIEEFKQLAKDRSGAAISKEAGEAITFLEDKKAEGLFKTAQFYERQKHLKSAAIYYEDILNRYPHSSFTEPARLRLDEIDRILKGKKPEKRAKKPKTVKEDGKKKKWIFF